MRRPPSVRHSRLMDPPTRPTGRPLRVLIIDRHPAFRVAVKALLQTEGLQVIDVLEPATPADHTETSPQPDVVLIDVSRESLDGLELARRYAAAPDSPAIVLMSAVPADELLTAAVGADAFFAKAAVSAESLTRATATARIR